MKETLQKNYKRIISYAFVAVAVVSVLITGIMAIKKVHSVDLKEYQVHGQFEQVLEPGHINEPESYIHEFQCVGKDMKALLIQGNVWELSGGIIWYRIEDVNKNVIVETVQRISESYRAGYDGIWIDVSEIGLEQGEYYTFTLSVAGAHDILITYEDFKITVAQIFEYNYAGLYTGIIVALMGISYLWLYFVYKNGYSEKLYVMTSLVLGLLVIFLMPPANRDDEYRHFLRAYMDVKGLEAEYRLPTGQESGLITDNPYGEFLLDVSSEVNDLRLMGYRDNYNGFEYRTEINQFLCIDKLVTMLNSEPVEYQYGVSVAAVAYKNSSSYWPQVIAMKLGDLFGARDLVLYYMARLGQLFICIFMEVLAMKLAPSLKEIIWLLTFIPNAFILKASCNPDGLMTAEILLLAALVVWMREEKIDLLSRKGIAETILYLGLSYNIMMMKLPYIIISICLVLYLKEDNVRKAIRWIENHKSLAKKITIAIGVLCIVCAIVFRNVILNFVYSFLPQAHIEYIFAHPGEIIVMFVEKWGFMCFNLLSGMNGEFFVPYAVLVFVIIIMLKKRLPNNKRISFAALFAFLVMVIVLVGYSMSAPDYGAIEEIGYRYLLPFLVVGAFALPSGNEVTDRYAKKLMPLAIYVTMTTTMITWIVGWSV
ncbi:MAG: DUF2142 domain-containing protein [Agathobacter sp.]|nr:DUF2142 domain-containing protein [Agathobacter sp.]